MSDFQAIADRVEIEALRGEFTDAVMMRDHDRVASLFTHDGEWRMPNIPAELAGREQIRAWGERVPALVDYLVQTTHPGSSPLAGSAAQAAGTPADPPAGDDLQERVIGLTSDKAVDRPTSANPPVPEGKAVLPDQSPEDTDSGWGERPGPDDDERLYGERPPHWDSA
jgi:SnoaL-like domain